MWWAYTTRVTGFSLSGIFIFPRLRCARSVLSRFSIPPYLFTRWPVVLLAFCASMLAIAAKSRGRNAGGWFVYALVTFARRVCESSRPLEIQNVHGMREQSRRQYMQTLSIIPTNAGKRPVGPPTGVGSRCGTAAGTFLTKTRGWSYDRILQRSKRRRQKRFRMGQIQPRPSPPLCSLSVRVSKSIVQKWPG